MADRSPFSYGDMEHLLDMIDGGKTFTFVFLRNVSIRLSEQGFESLIRLLDHNGYVVVGGDWKKSGVDK